MKRALRLPLRWAGWWRTLGITAVLSVALGACSTVFGAREGTIEYPGSGAGPNAVAIYVVKDKDTVESLSQRYGVPVQTIIDRNKLASPYRLKPGQSIELPNARFVPDNAGGPRTATAAANATAPGPVKRETLAPPSQGEPPRSAAPAPAASGQPTPLGAEPASKTAVSVPATPPPATSQHFIWPVKGKVLVPYGTSGGQKNDGIDIQAETGEAVKAADGGKVVYSGSEVAHLGNLLLIQHPGGYITAYGNNEALLVKKGEEVKKGQTIAKAGSSGGVASPRVHFEVRRGSRTLDPTTVLPAQ